jgi:hypothetical protein
MFSEMCVTQANFQSLFRSSTTSDYGQMNQLRGGKAPLVEMESTIESFNSEARRNAWLGSQINTSALNYRSSFIGIFTSLSTEPVEVVPLVKRQSKFEMNQFQYNAHNNPIVPSNKISETPLLYPPLMILPRDTTLVLVCTAIATIQQARFVRRWTILARAICGCCAGPWLWTSIFGRSTEFWLDR